MGGAVGGPLLGEMTLPGNSRGSFVEGGEMGVRVLLALGAGRGTGFTSLRRGGTAGAGETVHSFTLKLSPPVNSCPCDYREAARKG